MTDEPLSANTDTSYSSTWSDGQATDHTDATAESPVIGAPAGPSSYRRATHYSPAIPTPSMSQIIRTCQWDTVKVPGAVYMKNSATGRKVELYKPWDSEGRLARFSELEGWERTDSLTLDYLPTFQGKVRQAWGRAIKVSKEGFKKLVKHIIVTYTESWAGTGGTDRIDVRELGHLTELKSLVSEALSDGEVLRMTSWKSLNEIHNFMTDFAVPVGSSKLAESVPLDADGINSCQILANELYSNGLRVKRCEDLANEEEKRKVTKSCIATAARHLWHAIEVSSDNHINNETVKKEMRTLINADLNRSTPWLEDWGRS